MVAGSSPAGRTPRSPIGKVFAARWGVSTPEPCPCDGRFHRPHFIAQAGVSCSTYGDWLARQAFSIKRRFTNTAKRPSPTEIKRRLHRAVERSGGYDFYTGEPLAWELLDRPCGGASGRRAHCQRGKRPSVDHFTGVNSADFRLCSGEVNGAKGALSHQRLCDTDAEGAAHRGRRWRGSERLTAAAATASLACAVQIFSPPRPCPSNAPPPRLSPRSPPAPRPYPCPPAPWRAVCRSAWRSSGGPGPAGPRRPLQ